MTLETVAPGAMIPASVPGNRQLTDPPMPASSVFSRHQIAG